MSTHNDKPAVLYLVATPIGNLGDISSRAIEILNTVDLIAAEDTRHSKRLLQHYGIGTRLIAYHEHNEAEQSQVLIDRLKRGQSIALISDAGTPLVSDPGYRLVSEATAQGLKVVPVPGPCAAITALSASGLPTDRFTFEGFPPAKQGARQKMFQNLKHETRTMVFYVSCHRIIDTLKDMAKAFGDTRHAVMARELTKAFETIRSATLGELLTWVEQDENQRKGEIVILLAGADTEIEVEQQDRDKLLTALVAELPVKQAAKIASAVTGMNKNDLYKQALEIKDRS